jgi:8-hydroxy-5-deazaflavin:NADPH oxidoreductase
MTLTTAIIGVGNLGSALARRLVGGDEPIVLAAKDDSHAEAVSQEIGPLARAASVEYAIATAHIVVFAVWLETIKELIAGHGDLLHNRVVVDPSNPLGFDENGQVLLPGGDLHQMGLNGELPDLDRAREVLATTEVTA